MGYADYPIALIHELIKLIFLDRLLTYASFAPELRRPVYSAMLDLDAGADAIRSKVDQIYSSQYQTPEAFSNLPQ